MRCTRFGSYALVLGLLGFLPKAIAEEPGPAPAPPPHAPAGPDDVRRQIHELELKLKEAKEAGREREEAKIQATLEQLRSARREREQAEAMRRKAEEARRRTEEEAREGEGEEGALKAYLLGVDRPGEGKGPGPDGARRMRGGPGAPGRDGVGPMALERLKRVHDELADRLRDAMAGGRREEAEVIRAQLGAVEARMEMLAKGGGPGGMGFGPGGPPMGGEFRGAEVRHYKELEFGPGGDLDRRLDALRQAAKLLKAAGLDDRAKGLMEDIGRLEREQAARRQQAAMAAGGADGALVAEVHALREQIQDLRGEVKQLRAMLEKALSR